MHAGLPQVVPETSKPPRSDPADRDQNPFAFVWIQEPREAARESFHPHATGGLLKTGLARVRGFRDRGSAVPGTSLQLFHNLSAASKAPQFVTATRPRRSAQIEFRCFLPVRAESGQRQTGLAIG